MVSVDSRVLDELNHEVHDLRNLVTYTENDIKLGKTLAEVVERFTARTEKFYAQRLKYHQRLYAVPEDKTE